MEKYDNMSEEEIPFLFNLMESIYQFSLRQ